LIYSTLIIVVTSYLLGSIPFGYLLVRIFRGQDVRKAGSGNIGATNVARTGSKGLAIATLLLDAVKGYAAVAIALWLPGHLAVPISPTTHATFEYIDPNSPYLLAALAALFAILGHMFPVWLRFKGGKGVATALGAFLALAPTAVMVSFVLFVVAVALTRYVSLGSILAAAIFPFAAWWLNPFVRTAGTIVLLAASSLLIIIRHKDNIGRLLAGTENRFR
jgi:glycerol-3-phosphate acyltransferase PlsY